MIKKNKVLCFNLFLLFITFLLIAYFTPLMGDDWPNYGDGTFSIIGVLKRTYHYYIWWEGRIGSRILIFSITWSRIIWSIVCAIIVLILVLYGTKIIDKENRKNNMILLSLLLLFINYYSFTQNFLWIAGSVTYTFVTAFYLLYIYYIFNKIKKDERYSKLELFILCLFNIFLCTFVENVAVAILFGNILLFFYYFYKKNKEYKRIIFIICSSLIGFFIQILSPGTAYRISVEASEFNKYNIIRKALINLPKLVKYGFLNNPIMIFIMVISICILIIKKVNNKFIKICLLLYFSIVPVISIFGNLYLISPFENNWLKKITVELNIINNCNNVFIIIYWLLFIVLYFIVVVKYIDNKNKLKSIFIYLVGMFSICSMLMSPTWSERVSFMFVFFNYLLSLIIINDNISNNTKSFKYIYNIFEIILVTYVSLIIVIYFNVFKCVKYRNNYIREHDTNSSEKIKFYLVPDKLLWNQYPYNNQYKDGFKKSLNLVNNLEYEPIYDGWKYEIFFDLNTIKNK